MGFVNAKCPNCNANLTVDSQKEAATCEYCGNAYIVEKAINNYNTIINAQVVNMGAESANDLVASINKFIEIKDWNSANNLLKKMQKNFISDYRTYWIEFLLLTHGMDEKYVYLNRSNYHNYISIAKKGIALAPDDKKDELQSLLLKFSENFKIVLSNHKYDNYRNIAIIIIIILVLCAIGYFRATTAKNKDNIVKEEIEHEYIVPKVDGKITISGITWDDINNWNKIDKHNQVYYYPYENEGDGYIAFYFYTDAGNIKSYETYYEVSAHNLAGADAEITDEKHIEIDGKPAYMITLHNQAQSKIIYTCIAENTRLVIEIVENGEIAEELKNFANDWVLGITIDK